jgi:hypothetical protein
MMADPFTQFSCMLDVGTPENIVRAEAMGEEFAADLCRNEGGYYGFSMELDHHNGTGALWIYSDEYGNPEHVIQFVLRCATALSLQGAWGFTWSLTCSRLRVGCFGGGTWAVDLGTGTTIDCNAWLDQITTPAARDDAKTGPIFNAKPGGDRPHTFRRTARTPRSSECQGVT